LASDNIVNDKITETVGKRFTSSITQTFISK